jgi:hypothetical protein
MLKAEGCGRIFKEKCQEGVRRPQLDKAIEALGDGGRPGACRVGPGYQVHARRHPQLGARGKVRRLSCAGAKGRLACDPIQPQRARFHGALPFHRATTARLPAKAAVLDGEVMASDAHGRSNFARLHVRWTRPCTFRLWAFDLLAANGRDLRS